MIGAILNFFSEVIAFLVDCVTSFVNWCREHPKMAAAILVLVVTNALMWHFGGVHQANKDAVQISALKVEIKKANDETEARNIKIEQLEKGSKVQAEEADKKLAASNKAMDTVVANYKKKLAAEKAKKIQIVKVIDPVTKSNVDVEFNQSGQVVCSRLHDSYLDSVNELVRQANEKDAK